MADIPTYDANGKLVSKPPDWATVYWGSLGLPPDVSTRIDKIFSQYADHTTAAALAQQYLRSTKWYAATFPGIEYGIRNGFFTDETGYRQYVQQVNDAWQTFAGHPISGPELAGWLQQGKSADYLLKYIKGEQIALTQKQQIQALAGAQRPEGQLTPYELNTLGKQQAGIETPLGMKIEQQMKQAAQRLQGVFQGVAGAGSVGLGPQGPFSQTLAGPGATDVGA